MWLRIFTGSSQCGILPESGPMLEPDSKTTDLRQAFNLLNILPIHGSCNIEYQLKCGQLDRILFNICKTMYFS